MPPAPVPVERSDPSQVQAEALFFEYSDFLMEIFQKHLPEQDALDIFQGLYLKVATKGFPDNIEDARGYLYRTARNAINDHIRKAEAYKNKIQGYSRQKKFAPGDNPAKKVMRFDLLMKAFERIEKHLSPSYNQVFVQKYQHNLNHREIAEKLKIKKGTVDRYLSVGTKQIQELYDQLFGDLDE